MIQKKWITFLQQHRANLSEGLVSDFGDPIAERMAANSGDCLCDLSPLALIRVRGEDAKTFLQNQFSNDITEVTSHHSQLSAYCNAKGRVLTLFRILADNQDYLLQLPQERVQNTLKRLGMYILMSHVTLQDTSSELASIGISGPNVLSLLKSMGVTTDLAVDQSFQTDDFIIFRLAGKFPRFVVSGTTECLEAFWLAQQSTLRPVAYSAWLEMDIAAGLPQVYESTCESFVPQMLNLNSLAAISYTKGCYPGQEVVARMHYLGKQKRRMYRIQLDLAQAPQPGDSLYVNKDITEQSVGNIVHSSMNTHSSCDALAVIQIKHAENSALFLHSCEGAAIKIKELPYQVELEGN